jgi:glycerophosphoryl diester phosphodiesterase
VGKVAIIAHRGASAYAPENTSAAFRLARKQAADWYELDCRFCKSGEVVIMHDSTLDRTTASAGRVADTTLSRLAKLGVPTLHQALRLAGPGFGCYIEIKGGNTPALDPPRRGTRTSDFDRALLRELKGNQTAELARAVIRVIRSARKSRQVVIQSFSTVACAVVAIEAPDLRVELLGSKPAEWTRYVRSAQFFGFAGVNTSLATLTPSRLKQLKAAGLSCAVYTVNRREDMRRLADWGVDGVITDRPDVCRKVLGADKGGGR